jgi:hypothetical protein
MTARHACTRAAHTCLSTRNVIMKSVRIMAAAFALSSSVASVSHAASIGPVGAFTASGSAALTKGGVPVMCTATFTGNVLPDGTAQVTAATFKGGLLCGGIKGVSLPWRVIANTTSEVTIADIKVDTLLGACTTPQLVSTWSNEVAELSYANVPLQPNCTITATLGTTPRLSIQ